MLAYGSLLALTLLMLGKFPYEIMTGVPIKLVLAEKSLDTDSKVNVSNFYNTTVDDAMNQNVTRDFNGVLNTTTNCTSFCNTTEDRNILIDGDAVDNVTTRDSNAKKERVKRDTLDPIKLVINADQYNTDNTSVFFSKVFEIAEKMYKGLKLNDTVKVKDNAVHFETVIKDTSGNITGPTLEIGIYEKVNSTDKKVGEGSGYFKLNHGQFTVAPEAIDDNNRTRSKRIL